MKFFSSIGIAVSFIRRVKNLNESLLQLLFMLISTMSMKQLYFRQALRCKLNMLQLIDYCILLLRTMLSDTANWFFWTLFLLLHWKVDTFDIRDDHFLSSHMCTLEMNRWFA
ncbi:hypothetical protein T4B_9246 [Trichinella pseudospiralis]|uniref:Uncharacterized protein n=1 Tax=Trichinella pseudospiralis TaxID=6337 RepID=A0A0V1EPL3_TRIPS|nr:hypothetical protein T4A_2830 [Trichinella pseudospiralis]KRZ28544.1 hypothetical protein T4B_9246 [Trichinella pseudospiralis]KRZ35301.1 hypothetical protein T4C_10270 [Trichinella pseudospiralis]